MKLFIHVLSVSKSETVLDPVLKLVIVVTEGLFVCFLHAFGFRETIHPMTVPHNRL